MNVFIHLSIHTSVRVSMVITVCKGGCGSSGGGGGVCVWWC